MIVLLAGLVTLTACSPVKFQEHRLENRLARHGLSEHVVDTGKATIHYWKGGAGPHVLLLHGFGADGLWTWHPQVDELVKTHTVVIPDLIWFGESSAHEPHFSLEFQAETFLDLLRHEEIERADLVGISYGGLVAFQMTIDAPQAIDRLVLVDSPGPVFTEADHMAMLERMNATNAADILIPNSPNDVNKLFELAYHSPPKLPQFLINDTYNNLFTDYVAEKRFLLEYLESNRDKLTEREWTLEHPTLLIWGKQDTLFPVSIGERLQSRIGPNARMHVIDQASHAPNIEQPQAFNLALKSFLAPHTPR